MASKVEIIAIEGVPLVRPGDDLARLFAAALERQECQLHDDDIIVVAQKVISKVEGRFLDLATLKPSQAAQLLAEQTGKDARQMEAVLRESKNVIRHRPGVVVVEHRLGHVMANAGIDHSNVGRYSNDDTVLLLPEDPDASAVQLKQGLEQRLGAKVGVIISDSVGRAWRLGTIGMALGLAGIPALEDRRGDTDLFGRELQITITGFADAVAAAATLVMGEADEATPAVVVRGLRWKGVPGGARDLLRPREEDMFR